MNNLSRISREKKYPKNKYLTIPIFIQPIDWSKRKDMDKKSRQAKKHTLFKLQKKKKHHNSKNNHMRNKTYKEMAY